MSSFYDNVDIFYKPVAMPGGWKFNHVQTLKRIDLYYNSQFETGSKDSLGKRKYFFNITKPPCDVATKFIDLDTKDINLISVHPDNETKVWLMQRELTQWMKESGFGHLLNTVAVDYPKYGSVVLKIVEGRAHKVNLQNLRMDPASENLKKSPFVYEVHLMTLNEIKDRGWKTKGLPKDKYLYEVWECYDYNGQGWNLSIRAEAFQRKENQESAEAKLSQVSGAQVGESRVEKGGEGPGQDYLPATELWKTKVSELPYRELHWEKLPGRWLGFGFCEYLVENQVAENEAENLERRALFFKALQFWQTKDDNVGRNVISDLENGDILRVNSEVTPVAKDNSDLAAFNVTRTRWGGNTERKTFTFDAARGENLPSRTPLGVAQLSAGMIASFFDLKKENYGLFIKDLVLKDIIPSFKLKKRGEHLITFLGSDSEIDKLDRAIAEVAVYSEIKKFAVKHQRIPSKEERETLVKLVEREVKGKRNRYIKAPDSYYEDAESMVDIIVTGEQLDTGLKNQTLQVFIQQVGTNPAILMNKVTRTALFWALELSGIPPPDLNISDEDITPMPQGGSVSAPQLAPPARIPANQTL